MSSRCGVNGAMLAVLTHLSFSVVLLTWMGNPYGSDGGSLALKIHPGSYMAYAACLAVLLPGVMDPEFVWRRIWLHSGIAFGVVCMLICVAYQIVFTGPGSPAVILDSYLPDLLIAFVLTGATPHDRSRLRIVLQFWFALNGLIALGESALQTHLIPVTAGAHDVPEQIRDFRARAFYDHPLTGATASALGLLMTPCIRAWTIRGLYLGLMAASLVAFGGRAALATSVLALLYLEGRAIAGAVLDRRPSIGWQLLKAATASLALAAVFGLAVAAGFGERLQAHFYWDSSADVRLAEWQLLGWLDLSQLLFGCPRPELLTHAKMLDLSMGVGAIENCWLLMFASLGILGFPIFLVGLGAFIVSCWRVAQVQGRVMIMAFLIIVSTSNSLGRKSPLLILMVAAVISLDHGKGTASRAGLESSAQVATAAA